MPWAEQVHDTLANMRRFELYGRVVKVVGMTVESAGPHAHLGDLCAILSDDEAQCLAEVVGFRDGHLLLMPLGDVTSVAPGADVQALHRPLWTPCGNGLLGRVIDGLGQPLDDLGPLTDVAYKSVDGMPPNPLARQPIAEQIQTGVRVVDALLAVGKGQRMGIFAGSGVGKSTLLSMMARNTSADVNVIALIGERGREVREFIERDLGVEGMRRSVVVVSTSDQPALIRLKGAFVATAIAEHFRDEGLSVNLMMDSLTRIAMAQREIGLAVGEPPTSRGYTPSVFALLPKLLERTGAGVTGSVTAFYTVLVDGDDLNDPIADAVRGILDGHIVLSRSLANGGQFPAVDVLASLSRLFPTLAEPAHQQAAIQIRRWLQRYREVEDLLRIGAYRSGTDADTDLAIQMNPHIRAFLIQSTAEPCSVADTLQRLCELAGVQP